ncbi:unnamed protein product, partial [Protopolystoma xenopodis]
MFETLFTVESVPPFGRAGSLSLSCILSATVDRRFVVKAQVALFKMLFCSAPRARDSIEVAPSKCHTKLTVYCTLFGLPQCLLPFLHHD